MYVGMNRHTYRHAFDLRCVPHVRGDEPERLVVSDSG